jgi:hypothetical protein
MEVVECFMRSRVVSRRFVLVEWNEFKSAHRSRA